MKCKKCGNEIGENQKFCKYCGQPVQQKKKKNKTSGGLKCTNCGAIIKEGSIFCQQCGAKVSEMNFNKKRKKKMKTLVIILILLLIIAGVSVGVYVYYQNYIVTDRTFFVNEDQNDHSEEIEDQIAEKEDDDKENAVKPEKKPEMKPEKDLEDEVPVNPLEDENGFILPDSNKKILTDSDIEGLTLQEINYAKNEIYARYGRRFASQELQDYFDSKTWYSGLYTPEEFDATLGNNTLNAYEKANAEFLREAEFERDSGGYIKK